MYKRLLIYLILLFVPITVLAYSDKILVGGETVGIKIESNGIIIIGFYKINGKLNKSNLRIGDKITHVNGEMVTSLKELTDEIEKYTNIGEVNVTYLRDKMIKNTLLSLVKNDEKYQTGLYVKDSIMGIGTLTYIDPGTKVYGALGHEIIESNTNTIVEVRDGNIFRNTVTSIDKSTDGNPGAKNAKFYYKNVYGNISKNTTYGIYGIYNDKLPDKELFDVAMPNEVKVGYADIYTVLNGEEINKYQIDITAINENNDIKNITFEITDKELLDKTGGVVQGMSGSPIIQNNKIIGAITHVVVDNVVKGYGIFITTMLEEGDR